MPRKARRQFTTAQKASILRRHFVDKVAISDLCAEYELQPSVFYYWQNQVFENLGGALQPAVTTNSREKELERGVEALKAKLTKKDSVIAEISEEYVVLKKRLGGPDRALDAPRHPRHHRRLRAHLVGAHGDPRRPLYHLDWRCSWKILDRPSHG